MISTIAFEHGYRTCSDSQGKVCRWAVNTQQHPTGCLLFQEAYIEIKDGWLQRCPECIKQFGEEE